MKEYKETEMKVRKMTLETPPREKMGEFGLVLKDCSRPSRSNSRSKGIGLNLAVSPVPVVGSNDTKERPVSLTPGNENLQARSPGSDEPSDLDIDMSSIEGWDIDEQLRLLALKEMGLVELKDEISNMNALLKKQEDDLHRLRQIIQRSLYKELKVSSTKRERKNSDPRHEAIASTRNRRRTLSNSVPPNVTSPVTPDTNGGKTSDKANGSNTLNGSKIWQKPLNLLQQFDTMLQTEFEKSLIPNQPRVSKDSKRADDSKVIGRRSEDSISTIASPLKYKSQVSPRVNFDKLFDEAGDDMFQSVSTSLWSFVHDVKQNVLSSLSEEQENELGKETKLNNSDFEDEFGFEDDDDDKIDLSMYSNLRKPSK